MSEPMTLKRIKELRSLARELDTGALALAITPSDSANAINECLDEIERLMGVLKSIANDDNAGTKPAHDCYDAVRFRAYLDVNGSVATMSTQPDDARGMSPERTPMTVGQWTNELLRFSTEIEITLKAAQAYIVHQRAVIAERDAEIERLRGWLQRIAKTGGDSDEAWMWVDEAEDALAGEAVPE